MAINNTGAMFKSFEFDGTDSRNFGVYITGAAVYDAPEREVEMISIPNRNGAFALDKGRFENIEITYPAGIYADTESDFAEGISDLRNFLCSKRGYCRLTDEYNPNEYRMAIYKSGLEVEPALLKAGEFEITFECMPQRYLNSGDEEIEVGEWGETETKTGDIVTIDNTDGLMAVKSLNVSLLPVQEGSGTPSPQNVRPITGHDSVTVTDTGKNLFNDTDLRVGGGFWYSFSSTYTQRQSGVHLIKAYPNTTYTMSKVGGSLRFAVQEYENTSTLVTENPFLVDSGWKTSTYTFTTTAKTHYIWLTFSSPNYSYAISASDVQACKYMLEYGNTSTTYESYQSQSTTVTLPHTVYGADVDVTGGESKETWANISSYNGETISEPWLSSMDEYVSGATPTTGAQVTYPLATPTDLQTTPTDVELLTGVNNISSPQGEITIEYGQNPNIVINPTLFDAKPMLEVYGYGTINIGSKIVTLYDQPVGDIVVAEQGKNSFSTTTVEIDDTYANLGDGITFERIFVQTDSRAPNNQYIYTPNISASGTDVTVSADVEVNGRQLLTTITLDSDSSLVFAYGTSKSVSAVANSSFTVHGSTVTSTTTIGLSYDGDKTFTLSRSVTFSQAGYALMMNNTFNLLGPTHLNSTQNLLGNPTYIDLSIGEAYRIDGDSAASLNNAVVLPIELPTLPKGETEITFDNTVTRLDIVPRWWKI